ncbi:MAG TPA: hypothetical protein VHD60_03350 [Candidatus Saccharimonadales bacterium]|nr:hypothetical protein [Candidatus Saccharimonadales bacterium]
MTEALQDSEEVTLMPADTDPALLQEYAQLSTSYRAARSDIVQHRQDPTIASEYARRACVLASTLGRPAEASVWIMDGLESLAGRSDMPANLARLRLLVSGTSALKPFMPKRKDDSDITAFAESMIDGYEKELIAARLQKVAGSKALALFMGHKPRRGRTKKEPPRF